MVRYFTYNTNTHTQYKRKHNISGSYTSPHLKIQSQVPNFNCKNTPAKNFYIDGRDRPKQEWTVNEDLALVNYGTLGLTAFSFFWSTINTIMIRARRWFHIDSAQTDGSTVSMMRSKYLCRISYIAVSALQIKCVQNDSEQVKKKRTVTFYIEGMGSSSPSAELQVELGAFERLDSV